jgi:hypothetical protein
MFSSKQLTCKLTLRQVLSVCAPEPHLPPFHSVYVHTVYLFTQGRGDGRELNLREGWMGNSS